MTPWVWKDDGYEAGKLEDLIAAVPPVMCGEKSHTTPTFLDQLRLLWFSGRGWELLRSLKNGTPGPDGIPYQVYALFGESIVGIFTDLAEEGSISGVAPRAQGGPPLSVAKKRRSHG